MKYAFVNLYSNNSINATWKSIVRKGKTFKIIEQKVFSFHSPSQLTPKV